MDSTLHVEAHAFSEVITVSETTRRHNQKKCIVSAEETVTTQERGWKIGIYPGIRLYRLKMSVRISQIRNRNFYLRNRNVYVTDNTPRTVYYQPNSLFRLLLTC